MYCESSAPAVTVIGINRGVPSPRSSSACVPGLSATESGVTPRSTPSTKTLAPGGFVLTVSVPSAVGAAAPLPPKWRTAGMPAPAIAMSATAAAAIGHRFLRSNFFTNVVCSVSGPSNGLSYGVTSSSNVLAGGVTRSSNVLAGGATGSATRAAGGGTDVFGGVAGAGSGTHARVGGGTWLSTGAGSVTRADVGVVAWLATGAGEGVGSGTTTG